MQSATAPQPGAALPSQEDAAEMTDEDKEAHESSLYKEDSFRMYCMKVLPCSKRYCHDWTTCPFSHPGEKARRRDPRTQPHTGIACPDRKKEGTCIRGDNCPYAHNVFEYWLHPTRYRTQLCNDGTKCRRHICFFAHSLEELRVPSCKPFVPPDALAAATTAAAAADAARKTAAATTAGAISALDPVTLRALAQAVATGAAAPQPDSQELELARTILQAPNAATSALVNQLSQMQMQNQQVNYQQQQQDQLKAISVLTAYLRDAQAQPQNQSQPPQLPQLPEQHAVDSWQHQHQQPGTSDRQPLAFRSLSEAAADRRSSDMLRAQLHAQQAASTGSLPTEPIANSASFLSPAVTAGTTLAQQSLLYAPTQLGSQLAQQALSGAAQQAMFPPFSPHGFAPRNPFGSQANSFDLSRSSFSDGAGRGSFSQQDWMSVGTSGRHSSGRYSGDRYSMDRRSMDQHSGDHDMFAPGNAFAPGPRRSSYGGPMMGNSYEVDWAGRPVNRADAGYIAGFQPHPQEALPDDGFHPFSNYAHPGHEGQISRDAFNPNTFNRDPGHEGQFSRDAFNPNTFNRDGFSNSVFHRASQDSDASTHMHTEGRPSMTLDDRPSMDSIRPNTKPQ